MVILLLGIVVAWIVFCAFLVLVACMNSSRLSQLEEEKKMVGMLWFDNDPKADLALKVSRAVRYYEGKYGKKPTLCYVHPSMSDETRLDGVEIKTTRSVLPNHLWIGIG